MRGGDYIEDVERAARAVADALKREVIQHALVSAAHCAPVVSIRQHSSAYVSIRQHTPAYVSIRTSAYASIRQHTYACLCARATGQARPSATSGTPSSAAACSPCRRTRAHTAAGTTLACMRQDTSGYVRIRQDTSAYVRIRQHAGGAVVRVHIAQQAQHDPAQRAAIKRNNI